MPFIEVKIFEQRLTEQTERELVEQLTQATVNVFGEEIRDQTWIVLTPVPAHRWGIAGSTGPRPATQEQAQEQESRS
ncbi:tautomerase family protein [Streptomyces sp. SKN60]|uniref:tautomerase family protein n=1 Tax=Streptomyces sp. SKN60 TaxID=2855506 RepID=UPI0022470322|nr:tautomerase family protein [Streptomyces sp. SKN60]MCX2182028.1 tautomerase family protein [Streptomyces sp. SKN60]